jgi:hypothetical protein
MLQTVEAIVEKNGMVRLLEPVHPAQAMRAFLTLVEPVQDSSDDTNDAHSLLTVAGIFESGKSDTSMKVRAIVTDFLLKKHAPHSNS